MLKTKMCPYITLILFSMLVPELIYGQNQPTEPRNGMHDFDFMVGMWEVKNERLKERAAGSSEWSSFTNKTEFYEPIMNGMANMDRSWIEIGGQEMEGVSIRVYNPDKEEWTIYWMADVYPELTEQVRGRWNGDTGSFYGEEAHNGTVYKLRFLWKKLSDNSVTWEQAYFLPHKKEWETNWKMKFTRLKK